MFSLQANAAADEAIGPVHEVDSVLRREHPQRRADEPDPKADRKTGGSEERPLEPRATLAIKQTARTSRALVSELRSVVDIATLDNRSSPSRLELKMWWFPWLTWLTIAAMIGVLVAMAVTPALATQLYASLVAVAVAVAAYVIVRVRRKRDG